MGNNNTSLIEGFKNGDEAAIKQLYQLHYKPLCYFNQKLVKYAQEAEDISTETFLKLIKKRNDFNNLSEIKSFLFTASKNSCIDYLRKEKRHLKTNQEIALSSSVEDLIMEQEMISAKVIQLIYAEIENLPTQCQHVFKLLYLEGKSTNEVALELNLSPQTVLNQKTKALQKLREILKKEQLFSIAILIKTLSILNMTGK